MAQPIKRPALVILYGTSLTTGYLSGLWDRTIQGELRARCNRGVVVMSMGRGSQTSDWAITMMDTNVTTYNPDFVISETFAINDSAPSLFGATNARTRHTANVTTFVNNWKTKIPNAHIVLTTMSTVSTAVAAGRPELYQMYEDDILLAPELGVGLINSYAGWPKPLPDTGWTNNNDGLHPVAFAQEQYHLNNVVNYLVPRINAMAA